MRFLGFRKSKIWLALLPYRRVEWVELNVSELADILQINRLLELRGLRDLRYLLSLHLDAEFGVS